MAGKKSAIENTFTRSDAVAALASGKSKREVLQNAQNWAAQGEGRRISQGAQALLNG